MTAPPICRVYTAIDFTARTPQHAMIRLLILLPYLPRWQGGHLNLIQGGTEKTSLLWKGEQKQDGVRQGKYSKFETLKFNQNNILVQVYWYIINY